MQDEGRARQSTGPHESLLRVGERLRESLQGAAIRTTDIRGDISSTYSNLNFSTMLIFAGNYN